MRFGMGRISKECTWGELYGSSGVKCRCAYCRTWFRRDQVLVRRVKNGLRLRCPVCMKAGCVIMEE